MSTAAIPSAGPDSSSLAGIGGGDADLGALLSEGWDKAAEASGESEPSGVSDPAMQDAPVGQPDAPAPQQADPTQQAAPAADASPFQLSPDGKFYQVPKDKLPSFQNAQKFHDAVSQYYGSPQEAQTSYFQASDHRRMLNDFATGDPNLLEGVLNFFATGGANAPPLQQQRHQQSFAKMAEIMPAMLQKVNPQAYEAMLNSSTPRTIEYLYNKAAQTNNPDDFKRAQEFDWGATGQYKTELPKIDPQQAQLTQQQRQLQDFETRQTAAYNRDVSNFNNQSLEGAKFKALGDMLDRQMAKAKAAYPEKTYQDLKAGVHKELIDRMKQDREWWEEHAQDFNAIVQDFKTTWSSGQPGQGLAPRIQAYNQNFIQRAQRYLPSIAAPRITEATRAHVARTNGQPAAQQPQSRTNGTPSQNPVNGKFQRKSADEVDGEWDAMFAQFKT